MGFHEDTALFTGALTTETGDLAVLVNLQQRYELERRMLVTETGYDVMFYRNTTEGRSSSKN